MPAHRRPQTLRRYRGLDPLAARVHPTPTMLAVHRSLHPLWHGLHPNAALPDIPQRGASGLLPQTLLLVVVPPQLLLLYVCHSTNYTAVFYLMR